MILPILHTVGLIILGLSGYVFTSFAFPRLSRLFRLLLWILSSVVVLSWILYHYSIVHTINQAFLIQVLVSYRLEYTAFFVGVFAALLQERTNRKRPPKGFVTRHNGAVLTMFILLPVCIEPILFPMNVDMIDDWKEDACIQSTGYTCGPACVATLLKSRGILRTEEELARELLCSRHGSSMFRMGRCLERHGFDIEVLPTPSRPVDPPVPSLAGVGLGGPDGICHAIILLDKTGDRFTIIDPLCGRFEWFREKTWDNYHFNGYLLHIKEEPELVLP